MCSKFMVVEIKPIAELLFFCSVDLKETKSANSLA